MLAYVLDLGYWPKTRLHNYTQLLEIFKLDISFIMYIQVK